MTDSRINRLPEIAPHTLFTAYDSKEGRHVEESLHVRVFYDASILEVFVNSRTVITTRIYPATDECFGIRLFADAGSDSSAGTILAHVELARLWDRLPGTVFSEPVET